MQAYGRTDARLKSGTEVEVLIGRGAADLLKASLQFGDQGFHFVGRQVQRIVVRTDGNQANGGTVEPGIESVFLESHVRHGFLSAQVEDIPKNLLLGTILRDALDEMSIMAFIVAKSGNLSNVASAYQVISSYGPPFSSARR
jgi:hypothetical protein